MSEITIGATVRHDNWGDGTVRNIKYPLLRGMQPTYQCEFSWQWGTRTRWCWAEDLTLTSLPPAGKLRVEPAQAVA